MGLTDKAANQLIDWQKGKQGKCEKIVTSHGIPVPSLTKTLTVGQRGPVLLQDNVLIETLAHWERERIPERVVHAKGAGAFGHFEVTGDITKYTKASVFEKIGKRTPIAIRFSTVAGERGSADTVRDPRGFAVKFYTEDGNWDLTGNNTPIFFVRDPLLFPNFIHSQKRNPQTHLKDPNMVWDFISLRPETLHQVAFMYSDRGIPDGYRHMNGYGSHTFKLVNSTGTQFYCKFHMKTDQGIQNLPADKALHLTAEDPDYATRDLYNSIANGDFPSWSMHIQVMTFEQADKLAWNPFDLTKIWPHSQFPLIPVGKLVLNRNPENYFAQVEQLAFSPANMIPGIEPSPDRMLQARLFAYADTHRHRLGPNYEMIPVNCPMQGVKRCNYMRDGYMTMHHQGGAPNYFPNSFSGPVEVPEADIATFKEGSSDVKRFDWGNEDNFSQVKTFWMKVLSVEEGRRLAMNIAEHLTHAQPFIQYRTVNLFTQVHHDFGKMIKDWLNKLGGEQRSQESSKSH